MRDKVLFLDNWMIWQAFLMFHIVISNDLNYYAYVCFTLASKVEQIGQRILFDAFNNHTREQESL